MWEYIDKNVEFICYLEMNIYFLIFSANFYQLAGNININVAILCKLDHSLAINNFKKDR